MGLFTDIHKSTTGGFACKKPCKTGCQLMNISEQHEEEENIAQRKNQDLTYFPEKVVLTLGSTLFMAQSNRTKCERICFLNAIST